ncbi:MAG: DNA-protecting protein DprA [Coriobacteriia bacterium]|nr:DNA-protecting protein DprA [Coriobacteriia bacterium]MCL2746086.1 DNA-protecting protein DprA [Coriobacteriia bacterium]MCL2870666.1 DNA-protecting protein DprA [Coriobacteriia bacterium]
MTKAASLQRTRFELTQDDALYPELLALRGISPRLIYGLGKEDALGQGVAIIGARNATSYGRRIARLVASWAADLGLVVYSGGARGCDQAAHQGALEAGGSTVAVMGCGADIVYPSRAEKLLDEITQKGAVISEYVWQTPPMKYRFRERNRLIAALSDLVIVVEARLPSGTLSTVHHALELGVPVAAVPGSILCLESAAPNRLISEGAFPICCRDDLALACSFSEARTGLSELYKSFEVNSDFESESHAGKIFAALQSMPALPDDLVQDLGLSLEEVLEVLGHFEVQGRVIRHPDGRYGHGEGGRLL